MTKHNFVERTSSTVQEALEHGIVRNKIDETLLNIKAPKGGLEERALETIALNAGAVTRALVLDRDPNLLRLGYTPPADQPWLEWDPVVVFVKHPDRVVESLAYAQQSLADGAEFKTEEAQAKYRHDIAVLQRLIECIEEQI